MENSKDFTARAGAWVAWSKSDWNERGWLSLCATQADLIDEQKRRFVHLGWNGHRFAQGKEIERLKKYDPDAEHILQSVLAEKLPKRLH